MVKKTKPAPAVLWPTNVQEMYGVTGPTRWRWERDGKLPPRDVYVGGKAVAWYRTTIEAAARGPQAAAV
jgi:predicted DNA-binding transcriptional regulator AlpA